MQHQITGGASEEHDYHAQSGRFLRQARYYYYISVPDDGPHTASSGAKPEIGAPRQNHLDQLHQRRARQRLFAAATDEQNRLVVCVTQTALSVKKFAPDELRLSQLPPPAGG